MVDEDWIAVMDGETKRLRQDLKEVVVVGPGAELRPMGKFLGGIADSCIVDGPR